MLSISVNNFTEWRDQARNLLTMRAAPDSVQWASQDQMSLFVNPVLTQSSSPTQNASEFRVPKNFVGLAKSVACFQDSHNNASKWATLYSVLWRIITDNRNLLALHTDPEVQALRRMCKAVSRDTHKMKAFVRFQNEATLSSETQGIQVNPERASLNHYTAWFEPDHSIVERVAPFFVKRFTGMNWSVMTPYQCAHWDQDRLRYTPGISRPLLQQDEFEDFWRIYYCSIFNPARLKEKAMMAEMPKKYWKYLPESICIKSLARGAAAKVNRMVEAEPTVVNRVRERSQSLRLAQDSLRSKQD